MSVSTASNKSLKTLPKMTNEKTLDEHSSLTNKSHQGKNFKRKCQSLPTKIWHSKDKFLDRMLGNSSHIHPSCIPRICQYLCHASESVCCHSGHGWCGYEYFKNKCVHTYVIDMTFGLQNIQWPIKLWEMSALSIMTQFRTTLR